MAEQCARKPVWPVWVRVLVTLGVVLAFYKLYAGSYCIRSVRSGKGVYVLSASGTYVSHEPVMNYVVKAIAESNNLPRNSPFTAAFWRLGYAVGSMAPAGFVGAFFYGLLSTRMRNRAAAERGVCRCRRCGYILLGLSKPQCPECGEAV